MRSFNPIARQTSILALLRRHIRAKIAGVRDRDQSRVALVFCFTDRRCPRIPMWRLGWPAVAIMAAFCPHRAMRAALGAPI